MPIPVWKIVVFSGMVALSVLVYVKEKKRKVNK